MAEAPLLPLAMFSWQEIAMVLLLFMFFFGAAKLPALARSLGSSVNEFKKGMKEGGADDAAGKAPPGDASTSSRN
jgi:TatA/E family protein of Tat protein translocase